MADRDEPAETPEARFVSEDRTSVLANYPRACPKCDKSLPVTRARFPLRFSPKAGLLLVCGGLLAVISSLALLPLIFLLFAGTFWVPGVSLIERALSLDREYAICCQHCGFSFRVTGPRYE